MWEKCTYHVVYYYTRLNVLTSDSKRKFQLTEYYRVRLLNHGRTWGFDSSRRALLAAMISRLVWATHISNDSAIQLMNYYNDTFSDDINEIESVTNMNKCLINQHIFTELITVTLELGRRSRQRKHFETAMFIILNCLFVVWNTFDHSTLFNADILSGWCSDIANSAPETNAEIAVFLQSFYIGVPLYHVNQLIQRGRVDVRALHWRQQRKRKRKTTDAIGACGICFDENIPVKKTCCGHDFCANCLNQWNKPTCPTCRHIC